MASFTEILVPLDLAGGGSRALEYATQIAVAFDAAVVLLHLHEGYGSETEEEMRGAEHALADHVARLEEAGIDARKISRVMDLPTVAASQIILEAAREEHVDLIVMATHGRTGIPRILLGSVTEEVVREAPCPVLVVHGATPASWS